MWFDQGICKAFYTQILASGFIPSTTEVEFPPSFLPGVFSKWANDMRISLD